MKRAFLKRVLAVSLVLCTAMTTIVDAAPSGRGSKGGRGNSRPSYTQSTQEQETSSSTTTTTMSLVESADTVANGEELRASTYLLTTTAEDSSGTATETSTSTVIKYFPITMYDYNRATINAATDALDSDLTVREGLYFSNGGTEVPYTKGSEGDLSDFVGGQYYIQNIRANTNNVGSWLKANVSWNSSSITSTSSQSDATLWTLVVEGDKYYLTYIYNNNTYYLTLSSGEDGDELSTSQTAINISAFAGDTNGVQLSRTVSEATYYLCQWGSPTATGYGGYTVNNDGGNGLYFYRVDGDTQTLVTPKAATSSIVSGYEAWNRWDKANSNADGQKIWTGLVESTLDVNKDIVFTVPEGGIFNSNTAVKNIYTEVQLPFVYVDGTYTFDASVNGVYFYTDATQGSSGTAAKGAKLYFAEGVTQSNGGTYGDGSSTVWMPFNNVTDIGSEANCNYHFGMRTTIPFTMTSNGRIKETDDTSKVIKFSFSGDDDVWVFIDGQLVIDLGGIHNRLDATIDFAANTVTYSANNSAGYATGSYNDSDFELEQTLFGNLIAQDRASFAAADSHELTIFYLERGAGSSNCKIEFNLPMKDSVTVTKHATQSYDSTTGTVSTLTDGEQAIVNNIDFPFTLYKKVTTTNEDGTTTVTTTAVAETNYYLLNENGQVVSIPSTDANGSFTLKNGQSAKFITELEANTAYYVVEGNITNIGFVTPDYNYGGESANGFVANAITYTKGSDIPEQELDLDATENKSYEVTVLGSDEYEDSLVFICENYLDAELPNPSARPVEDKIVIDYGLPVEIDVLANDIYRGNAIELLTTVTGSGLVVNSEDGTITTNGNSLLYGTATVQGGKIVYTLNKQMTGVEVINYVVKVTGSTTNESTGTYTAYEYAVGTVYVIPATTMYYEENFAATTTTLGKLEDGFVTYTGANWQSIVGTAQTDCQEPGVVNTIGDSPYGSDVAYLNDSGDSNGTSYWADTTNGAVQFSYYFTGTGTSFFVRTSDTTGYMRIQFYSVDGTTETLLQTNLRDTYFDAQGLSDKTCLYNIPVYTQDELDYGTYKVVVTVAKANDVVGYHNDFYLDGIRVMNPLDPTDPNYGIATSAYATDAESNASIVTLRQKLVNTFDENGNIVWPTDENGNFVVFTDTDGTITSADDYISIGPKEEVYLNIGQSISFSLKTDETYDFNSFKIYMGMKAPFGSAKVSVNGSEITLNNAADCYYDVSQYATITKVTDDAGNYLYSIATFKFTSNDSIVSLTNIKVTGSAVFTIVPKQDEEIMDSEGGN